jgi:3-vinyl bacteriochlorophyllide hydratase
MSAGMTHQPRVHQPKPGKPGDISSQSWADSERGMGFASAAGGGFSGSAEMRRKSKPLYTPEERKRRDATVWTLVQGLLAPLQFLVFLVSLVLVLRYLVTGSGYGIATASVVLKTLVLYAIMITGSIWEKQVFGKWLFVPAFFWEDVFSMLVLGLHTAYLACLFAGWGTSRELMLLALAAYATYLVNATQFLLKLRAARLEAAL